MTGIWIPPTDSGALPSGFVGISDYQAIVDDLNTLGGAASYGTTLPSSPADGQLFKLVVDATFGIEWWLQYVAAEATYKWRFLGGPPLVASVDSQELTTSTSYTDLGTSGPSIVIPRLGEYVVIEGACIGVNEANASNQQYGGSLAAKLGSAATADAERATFQTECASTCRVDAERTITSRTFATSDVVKLQYKVSAGQGSFTNRRLAVYPKRIG